MLQQVRPSASHIQKVNGTMPTTAASRARSRPSSSWSTISRARCLRSSSCADDRRRGRRSWTQSVPMQAPPDPIKGAAAQKHRPAGCCTDSGCRRNVDPCGHRGPPTAGRTRTWVANGGSSGSASIWGQGRRARSAASGAAERQQRNRDPAPSPPDRPTGRAKQAARCPERHSAGPSPGLKTRCAPPIQACFSPRRPILWSSS